MLTAKNAKYTKKISEVNFVMIYVTTSISR
jgi:hypothetical protein